MFAAGVFIPVFIPPTILQALAFWLNSAQLITPAKTARSVFDIFFIVLSLLVNLTLPQITAAEMPTIIGLM